jgi:AcrR family transcriptional regulator
VNPQAVDRPKRRRAETVERLLDAALETFAEIGFAAASVEDICRRGGFTRGAFYSSFRTKDELFGALFARETARNLARAEQQLAGIEQEADPVTAAVERCLSTFRADRTWVLVHTEYRLHAARHPEAAAALREHSSALRTRLTQLIETAAGRAGVRLALPAGELARIVVALHDGVVITQIPEELPDDPGSPALERTALLLLLSAAARPTD